jgi:hypothetical protein
VVDHIDERCPRESLSCSGKPWDLPTPHTKPVCRQYSRIEGGFLRTVQSTSRPNQATTSNPDEQYIILLNCKICIYKENLLNSIFGQYEHLALRDWCPELALSDSPLASHLRKVGIALLLPFWQPVDFEPLDCLGPRFVRSQQRLVLQISLSIFKRKISVNH